MNKMTYQQAYNKIIEAYFKDEIKPMDDAFCFCGTLNNNKRNWCGYAAVPENNEYTQLEFGKMERSLFEPLITMGFYSIDEFHRWKTGGYREEKENKGNLYEDALFDGMCAAIDVLKEIHRSRGENVDEVPEFTKRKLVATN